MNDAERIAFLRRLDCADVEVTDWEAEFIERILAWDDGRSELALVLSPKQRHVIDLLHAAYADQI